MSLIGRVSNNFFDICGCNFILQFPISMPKNSILFLKNCAFLELIIIPSFKNYDKTNFRCPTCSSLDLLWTSISST